MVYEILAIEKYSPQEFPGNPVKIQIIVNDSTGKIEAIDKVY